MPLRDALKETRDTLAGLGDEATREAQHLLTACLNIPLIAQHTEPERLINAQQIDKLRAWAARRASGEPLAYLTGRREFWSLEFAVTPDVLVPRPDTELLVERILCHGDELAKRLENGNSTSIRVADLGTGSGIIAITVAHERPDWLCTAVDVSSKALAIAAENAQNLVAGRVTLRHGSWFEPLADQHFDVIASNPPYVDSGDPVLKGDSLAFEPLLALTAGPDALAALNHLIEQAPRHLVNGGWLCLEHGAAQGLAIRERLVARGYAHVVSHRDLAGHERVTEGQWLPDGNRTSDLTSG
jgi:release factor glutamine methyltransferase